MKIEQLLELAEKATQGEREWIDEDGSMPMLMVKDTPQSILGCYVCKACQKNKLPCMAPLVIDADFIAAANPQAVAELCRRLLLADRVIECLERHLVNGCVEQSDAMPLSELFEEYQDYIANQEATTPRKSEGGGEK